MKSQKPMAIIAARELVSSASSVKILFFFFLVSDFFLAFSLDRQTNTQTGQGCGELFYVVCVVIYLVCFDFTTVVRNLLLASKAKYNTPLDEFPLELGEQGEV